MSLTEQENERMKVTAWKRRAKGHPIRWRMLRDAVAILSLGWMTTSQFQIAMRRLWAFKNNTARDMLEELEQERAITQERDEDTQVYKWGATRSGVDFWIRQAVTIPASVVEVAELSRNVTALEVSRNE